MARWACSYCSYAYDPELGDPDNGIPAGTPFASLPDDWVCPWCGQPKDDFISELEMI
ncbi:MAG: rubredoxin [Planctomycetes bacterium]|nr:rubredoxin [Planctomycetota bacterium]